MEKSRLKNHLEVGSNIAVILVAALILSVFAYQYFRGKKVSLSDSGLQKGRSFGKLSGYDYANSPRSLIVVISTRCGYCSASIPFYNRLAETQGGSRNINIVTVFPDKENDAEQYVREKQLNVDNVIRADFHLLKIRSTPTIILTDSKGEILDFWIGQLTEDKEQQVIKAINVSGV